MASVSWPRDQLEASLARTTTSTIDDIVEQFSQKWAKATAPKPPTFSEMLPSLTPWMQAADTSGGVSPGGSGTPDAENATPSRVAQPAPASPKPSSFSDMLTSLTPWMAAEKPLAAPETIQPSRASYTLPATGVADVQPAAPVHPVARGGPPAPMPQASTAPAEPGSRRATAQAAAQKYGVDWGVFDRQLNQESGYQDDAVSSAGARGPGQFMPATGNAVARQLGVTPAQFWASPELQIEGAALHMRDLLAANNGDYRRALAAYNTGQGNVDRWGEGVFADDYANGQTRDYVNIILGPGTAGRSAPNAGAAPQTAPAAPPVPPAAGSPPAASGSGVGDQVPITNPISGQHLIVPRARLGDFVGPGLGWQVEGAPAARTSLSDSASSGDSLRMALASTGQGDTMQRQALGQPPRPSTYGDAGDDPGGRSLPMGVTETDPSGYRGYNPGNWPEPPSGYPSLDYPLDDRPPGERPYDATDDEGVDRSNDGLLSPTRPGPYVAPGRAYGVPDSPRDSEITPPSQMYRQPLGAPTRGDTLTGDQQPYDPDQGPRESGYTVGGFPDPSGGGASAPGVPAPLSSPPLAQPATYGDAGDAEQVPSYQPTYGPPLREAGPEQPAGGVYLDLSVPSPPGWQALVDAGGNVVQWVREKGQQAYNALEPARTAAASLDQGKGYGQVTSTPGEPDYVQTQQNPVIRALTTPIRPPERPKPLVGPFDLSNEQAFPTQESRNRFTTEQGAASDVADIPYQAAEAGRQSVMDAAQSFADVIRAGQEGRPLAAAGNALWSALQVAGLPWTVAARTLNELLPEANVGGVGVGDAATSMDLLNLGIKGVNGLRSGALGRALSPENLARADETVSGLGTGIGRGARALGEEGARQVMDLTPMPRVVPPSVADTLDFPVRVPTDPSVVRAIEAAGGTVDERGVTLNVIRNQDAEAHGGVATRGAPFYVAGPPGAPNPYAARGPVGVAGVGGPVRIEGQTRFRSPLIISDAPGEPEGFNDAVRQLDIRSVPQGSEAEIAAAQARADAARAAWQQAKAENVGAPFGTLSPERQAEIELATANDALARLRGGEPIKEYQVRAGIDAAKRAGPAGSPERAQALKDLVSRYGGDPELIDPLIALRGADMGESVYAVKENIVSHNARAKGYDGVITVQPQTPSSSDLLNHPKVVAAEDTDELIVDRLHEAQRAYERNPGNVAAERGLREAERAAAESLEAVKAAKAEARAELTQGRITELMDPREARNPTPGAPDQAAIADVEGQIQDLSRSWMSRLQQEVANDPTKAIQMGERPEIWITRQSPEMQAEWARVEQQANDLRASIERMRQSVGTPGYTLREDIPRAPGTRASTITENAPMAAAGRAYDAAVEEVNRLTLERQKWARTDPRYQVAEVRLKEAEGRRQAAWNAYDAFEQRGESQYVTANAGAGALPASATPDRLSAVNRVLAQGVASTFSGGTAAAAADQLGDPNDPNRQAKAFVAGALAPPLISGGIRAIARSRGARTAAEGALATLGNVPPSKVNQGVLPDRHPLQQPPPTPIGQAAQQVLTNLPPTVANALTAAQRRAQKMAANGLTTPSAWDWLKQAGYAGIYGPATAVNSAIGGAQELLLGQPKEAIRALVEGRPVASGASSRATIAAAGEGIANLGRVLLGDAGVSSAASGGSRGTAGLSARLVGTGPHLAARALERPGEILTEAPDAVFRPLFRSQGMEREAGRVAAEMKLPRGQRAAYAEQLVQDAQAVRSGQAASLPATQRVLDAGEKYADELGYKGQPGQIGQYLGKLSKRDDPIGVAASFLIPFPSMASRMTAAAVKSTPGAALLPGVRKMYPSRFDMIYDQAFGAVLASGVAYWAMNGGITGSGPDDKEKRQMMVDQGWQPNSTLVGGYYIPNRMFQRFQPFLDTAGELHDALAYGKKDRAAPDVAADLVKRGSRIATDQVGLSGLADLHDMLEGGFASQFPGWAARSATRYVPYAGIIRAAAASLDTKQRKPDRWSGQTPLGEAVGQNLEMAVPGLRQNVPAAQGTLGQDAPNPQQGLGAIIPRTTTQRDDPLIQAFQGAGVDIGAPPADIGGVPLSPIQQRRYRAVMGTELQRLAGPTVSAPNWQTTPPNVQKILLESFQSTARTLAETAVTTEGGKVFSDARTKAIIDKAMGR